MTTGLIGRRSRIWGRDTFTRSNSDSPGSLETGQVWVESGDIDIASNKAVSGTAGSNSDQISAVFPGPDIKITGKVVLVANVGNGSGVRFRTSWLALIWTSELQIWEGGVKRASTSVSPTLGVEYSVTLTAVGTSLTWEVPTLGTLTYSSATGNQTATTHGIRFGRDSNTFDDFLLERA